METQQKAVLFTVDSESWRIDFTYLTPRSAKEASELLALHGYSVAVDSSKLDSMLIGNDPDLHNFESIIAVWLSPKGLSCAEVYTFQSGLHRMASYTVFLMRNWADRMFLVKEISSK